MIDDVSSFLAGLAMGGWITGVVAVLVFITYRKED